jgi:uncharacterized protein GlcG (DUF336 family)
MALDLPSKKVLTLDAAKLAMAACEAEALRGGWRVAIAIVDDGGHTVMLHRLDGTQFSSIETAVQKAKASVAWKRPSRLLEESINNGRFAFLSLGRGMSLLQGGVPIEIDGQVLGAIGVSGVKAADDEIVALAGIRALEAARG